MPFTIDYELELPSEGAENTGQSINTNMQKIEEGRTHRIVLGEDMDETEVGYVKSDGEAYKARADSLTTARAVGFLRESGLEGADAFFKCNGRVVNAGWSLTVGDAVWLSPVTAGTITQTKPSSPDIPIFLGIAVAIDTVWIIGLSPFLATGSGSGVTDHGNLSGLGDDDHTQYLHVDGRRGIDMGSWNP